MTSTVMPDGHPLVQALGREAAGKVAAYCGGEELYVPSPPFTRSDPQLDVGSDQDIARRHGVSVSYVREVRRARSD